MEGAFPSTVLRETDLKTMEMTQLPNKGGLPSRKYKEIEVFSLDNPNADNNR